MSKTVGKRCVVKSATRDRASKSLHYRLFQRDDRLGLHEVDWSGESEVREGSLTQILHQTQEGIFQAV